MFATAILFWENNAFSFNLKIEHSFYWRCPYPVNPLFSKKSTLSILLLIAFAVPMRFVFLEEDQPANNISGYTQADEPYYCFRAVADEMMSRPGFPAGFNTLNSHILSTHNYQSTKLGFKIFGYNYTGLRITIVVKSLITIALLFVSIFLFYQHKVSPRIWFFLLAVMLIDPYFLVTSRLQNPQIDSILWLSLGLFLVFAHTRTQKMLYFFLSVLVHVLTVFAIYPYTIFALLAIGAYTLYLCYEEKSLRYIFIASLAAIAGFGIFLVTLQLEESTFTGYLHNLLHYNSEKSEIGIHHSTILETLKAPLQIIYTNLLRYNPLYLLVFSGLFIIFITKRKQLEKPTIYCIIVLIFGVIQSMFVVSYPFKKWVTLFPYLIACIVPIIIQFQKMYYQKSLPKMWILFALAISILLAVYTMLVTNNHEYWRAFDYGFGYEEPSFSLKWIPVLSFSLLSISIIITLASSNYAKHIWQFAGVFYLLGLLAIDYSMLYQKPRYEFKNFLLKSADDCNGKIIVGDLSHAYTFYNSALALVSYYAEDLKREHRLQEHVHELDKEKLIYIKNYLPHTQPPKTISSHSILFVLKKYYPGNLYAFAIYSPEHSKQ